MSNNTVPTHSVVDPRGGSQTSPCWLQWKTNHFLYKIIYKQSSGETLWAFTVVTLVQPPLPSGKN